MIYIGIDPGQKGGLAVIDDRLNIIGGVEMPSELCNIEEFLIESDSATNRDGVLVCIEKAQAMPQQGVVGVFTYGVGYGKLLACAELLNYPYQEIRPAIWKKHFGLIKDKKGKEYSVRLAEKLFPTIDFRTKRGRLKDGLAEAFLIAQYGKEKGLKGK